MDQQLGDKSAIHCPVCKKRYTNGTNSRAKSKHVSYCRKKHQVGPLSRRKACDECVRSKVRCSAVLGGCSRCASRGLSCTYQGTLNSHNIADLACEVEGSGPVRTDTLQPTGVSPVDIPVQASDDRGLNYDSPSIGTNEAFGNSNILLTSFPWEGGVSNYEWSYVPNIPPGIGDGYSLGSHVGVSSATDDILPMSNITSLSDHSFQLSSSIPVSLTYRDSSSLFERRKFSETELEHTGDLALHILRSYPYTVAHQGSVPPFIHPKYQCLADSDTTRPSPLSAALKLAKMLLQGGRMNKKLTWGLIRVEQERLFSEHHSFGKWEVMEALQSLVVYILLRIIEGRHDYTNFDTQLLASINAMCEHITAKYGRLISSDELAGQSIPWKDWVFLESRRRTATTVLIINSILHAQIKERSMAMPEYSSSPAPSPMSLWGAENEVDWSVNYKDYLYQNSLHGMLKNSDLVQLKTSAGKQSDRWYAYADSFGLLVTLVANMAT